METYISAFKSQQRNFDECNFNVYWSVTVSLDFAGWKQISRANYAGWGLWTETQFHYPVHYNLLKQWEYKSQPWLMLVGCLEVWVLGCDWVWQPEGLTEGLGIFSETLRLRSMDSFWFMSCSRALLSTRRRHYTRKSTQNKRTNTPPAQPAAPELGEKVASFTRLSGLVPKHNFRSVTSYELCSPFNRFQSERNKNMTRTTTTRRKIWICF